MKKIFISYRRSDTSAASGRIYDRLVKRFGKESIFKDVDVIPLGVDFREHISRVLEQSAVQLVLIGPSWLNVTNEYGLRRLDLADDPVRMEIEIALRLGVALVPLLVDGAQLPNDIALPTAIHELAHAKAYALGSGLQFDMDLEVALSAIETQLGGGQRNALLGGMQLAPLRHLQVGRRTAISSGVAVAMGLTAAGAWWFAHSARLLTPLTPSYTPPRLRWQSRMPGPLTAGPTVTGGLVYAVSGGDALFALNASDGSVQWQQRTERQVTGVIAADQGLLCVGSPDGYVYGFNAQTGFARWRWHAQGSATGSSLPTVANGQAYVYLNGGLGSLDLAGHIVGLDGTDGSQQWSYTSAGSSEWPPVVSNDVLYAGTTSEQVFAITARDGSLRWSQVTAPVTDTVPTPLATMVFIGSSDGHTQALDIVSGSILWTTSTPDSIHFPPAADVASVYVGSENGMLYALRRQDGIERWRYSTGSSIVSPPLVVSDAVMASTSDGYLYALGVVHGELRWRYAVGSVPTGLSVANGVGYLGTAEGVLLALTLNS